MAKQKGEPKILLDADVVIHFIKAGYQMKLAAIFPDRLTMLDKVKLELLKRRSEALGVENFLSWCKIPVEEMPKDIEILREYAALKKLRGNGESACMAVARFRKEYIASSNIRDIKKYCEEHSIVYYTTLDVLEVAIGSGIMTEPECDNFIKEVKLKDSKMPCNTMAEFRKLKKKEY
ncbi:MAG: hypothetical protein QM530_01115 [Phycisphaerales bacterium]|nr:hypothetical protein [Phycisphaerales bacterium]